MEYRSLGRTGVQVSPLCLGAMHFGGPAPKRQALKIIDHALAGGINFIDTADVYQQGASETIVGEALKKNGRRQQVVLATKCFGRTGEGPNDRGGSRYHIIQACENSLRRLKTDHIDLYQLHRPPLDIPQDEILRALDDLVRSGKIRYIGTSTFPAWFLMEGLATSDRRHLVRYVSEQPPYNLLDRRVENELLPCCRKHGLAVIPWSPLAGGILAGRYKSVDDRPPRSKATRGNPKYIARITPAALEVVARLGDMAAERGLSVAQLSLLWLKDQPGVTAPIVGVRTPEHLQAALGIMEQQLDPADVPLFDELVHPGNAVSDFHNSSNWMQAVVR